jgi:CBS domain containing-hemolysin-like protein
MITYHMLLLLTCMAASAFFSGIETGIISIHRFRLRHFVRQGSRNARILEYFIENGDRLLGTTLVGNNICLVVMSVAAASLALHSGIPGAQALSTPVLSVLIIVFGEYIPKAWFQARPIERCLRFSGLLRAAEWLLRPFAIMIIALARLLSPGERNKTFSRPAPFVTRDDLKILAREGEKDGVLSAKERYMIHRVIELSSRKPTDIMIPKEKIVAVHDDMPVPELFAFARQAGLTRLPVISRTNGRFTGVVNVFYVLADGERALRKTVAAYARPALFVPATMPADRLLPQMRRARQPICLVRDANSEIIGLVTTEDILRIIVGKL